MTPLMLTPFVPFRELARAAVQRTCEMPEIPNIICPHVNIMLINIMFDSASRLAESDETLLLTAQARCLESWQGQPIFVFPGLYSRNHVQDSLAKSSESMESPQKSMYGRERQREGKEWGGEREVKREREGGTESSHSSACLRRPLRAL